MARNAYSGDKRRREVAKKKKREEKLARKQSHGDSSEGGPADNASFDGSSCASAVSGVIVDAAMLTSTMRMAVASRVDARSVRRASRGLEGRVTLMSCSLWCRCTRFAVVVPILGISPMYSGHASSCRHCACETLRPEP